jgi:hypothetical protein
MALAATAPAEQKSPSTGSQAEPSISDKTSGTHEPETPTAAVAHTSSDESAPVPTGSLTVFGISILALLGLLKQIYDALTAFRVKPAALLKEAAGSASIKDLETRTIVRMDFARQFGDVNRALEPYRMVIFIDDLDRCNPKSVTQILESVNFLQSAGDCFVVMGLAKPQVEASIGLSFKEVAEELGDDGDAKQKRRDYAQQYLKKLIQLEVKVPLATDLQQEILLTGRSAEEVPETRSYAERLAAWGRANRPVAWVGTALILGALSFWYGFYDFNVKPIPTSAPTVAIATETEEAPPPVKKNEQPEQKGNQPAAFYPGTPEGAGLRWLPILPGLLLAAFAGWILARRPIEIIQDSENFTEALRKWRPVIVLQYDTPREMKRFLNRIRYIAMRWRRPSAQKTPIERVADWLQSKLGKVMLSGGKASSEGGDFDQFAEEAGESDAADAAIVMMAAVDKLGGRKVIDGKPTIPQAKDGLTWHKTKFGSLDADWTRYREITGEVDTN